MLAGAKASGSERERRSSCADGAAYASADVFSTTAFHATIITPPTTRQDAKSQDGNGSRSVAATTPQTHSTGAATTLPPRRQPQAPTTQAKQHPPYWTTQAQQS